MSGWLGAKKYQAASLKGDGWSFFQFSGVSWATCWLVTPGAGRSGKDIQLYINSPGGSITAGMAIYDTMQYVKNDVTTICIGQAASMAALLLSAGQAKKAAGACPIRAS